MKPVTIQRDIRETALYGEAEAWNNAIRQPGTGQISDAAEVHVSPDGRHAVFTGSVVDKLDGTPSNRICQVELASGDIRALTFGSHTDRLPKYSPDGQQIAFLSDRHKEGDFQLHLLDPMSGTVRITPTVEGWVEYLHWSPDGTRIVLGVAGCGADTSGVEGAVTSKQVGADALTWMPTIETGDESYRWRRAWVYELAGDHVRPIGRADSNIWEAVWCGNAALATVVSPGPREGLWYTAHLNILEIDTGDSGEVYTPRDQLGWPAASPSGQHLAVVEGICSDRWVVAGNLRLIETMSGRVRQLDTGGVDITYTEWRSDRLLLLAGHRGFDTVVGLYDLTADSFKEVWASKELSSGGTYACVSGLDETGACVLLVESFVRAPEIAVIRQGKYQPLKSFDLGHTDLRDVIHAVDRVNWKAPDGLEIQGWLLRPKGKGPNPLIMIVHGGPVYHVRPFWLGRGAISILMLLKRGIAVFFPNPRGSTGRGQEFSRRVLGDMGGADTFDCLSGLDYLVDQGIADPRRLGVTGRSYGGFMTSWLITQDTRFAAAVSVAPVTNWVSEHLVSNSSPMVSLFLADTYTNPTGHYFQRSPIMHAGNAKTPTLNICGALDRCTPPGEAMQYHNALLENGVKSMLVTYPEEGHGVRKWPALMDCAARMVAWFEDHLAPLDHNQSPQTSMPT